MQTVKVRFEHGLGDCVYFAHQVPLYTRRGWQVMVLCDPEKQVLFHAAGAIIATGPAGALPVPWYEGEQPTADLRFDNAWRWSKPARNLSLEPLPDIDHPAALWDEYCTVTLQTRPLLSPAAIYPIGQYIDDLARPLIVFHTQGATGGGRKDVPAALVPAICREFLHQIEGTVLLLDGDIRFPPLAHTRVRHVGLDFGRPRIVELLAVLDAADLVVGIDSGPLHAARFTSTPAIGIWMGNGSPVTWSLPRPRQVNIVVGREARPWARQAQVAFNLIECDEPDDLPAMVAATARRMLEGCRYLPSEYLGRDVLLQHLVLDGHNNNGDRGFDRLLRIAAARFENPRIVEVNSPDSGRRTLPLALAAASRGGTLISIGRHPELCESVRETVACLGDAVGVVTGDAAVLLEASRTPVDLLFLESAGEEMQAAAPLLHAQSVVAWDRRQSSSEPDVPWQLEHAWQSLHSGSPVILVRKDGCKGNGMHFLRESSFDEFVRHYLERERRKHRLPANLSSTPRRLLLAEMQRDWPGKLRPWFPDARWSLISLDTIDDVMTLICLDDAPMRQIGLSNGATPDNRITRAVVHAAREHGLFDQSRPTALKCVIGFRNKRAELQAAGWPKLSGVEKLVLCSPNAGERSENPSASWYLHDGLGRLTAYLYAVIYEGVAFSAVEALLAEDPAESRG